MNIKRSDNTSSICRAILGPTNTGKTHYALERMLSYKNGVIGVPLRLLAREIYDQLVLLKGKDNVVLNTGEEKIRGKHERYWVCTTEAMPAGKVFEFLAVDEIQLCADEERGHIFTERLLNSRGMFETLFLGSNVMLDLIKVIIPDIEIIRRNRFSKLSYFGKKKLSKLAPRSAVVDFSVEKVYGLAEQLRTLKGGAAVVLGALSPKTRNAQVELYQNGDVDYLIATDAIGMGLNLKISNVFFASVEKFDGKRLRKLNTLEIAQIAGRAGRHMSDGYFGETAGLSSMSELMVENVENNFFPMLRKIKWRNSDLEFNNASMLINSLDLKASLSYLERSKDGSDVNILKFINVNNPELLRELRRDDVKLLWKACQIPDFRKISKQDHAELILNIFHSIRNKNLIPDNWLKKEIRRLDNTQGDIDVLSKRLSFIRTWCFVSNISEWVSDADYFKAESRKIEDKLSDALHVKLTQRFVDLRRSVLIKNNTMRNFNQKDFEIRDESELYIQGHFFGQINGFIFNLVGRETIEEKKKLMQIVRPLWRQHLIELVNNFYNASESDIRINETGEIFWNKNKIGWIEKGASIYSPKVKVIKDQELNPNSLEKIERKISIFLSNRMEKLLPSLLELKKIKEFKGSVSGLIHFFLNNLGIVVKSQVIKQLSDIDQDCKVKLKQYGLRFGYKTIFNPILLKPEQTQLRLALHNAFNFGMEKTVLRPAAGLVTLEYDKNISKEQYLVAGFFVAGSRVIRVDMLERLYFLLRDFSKDAWFEVDTKMLSITGLGLQDFSELIENLGFDVKIERVEKGEGLTYEHNNYFCKVMIKKPSQRRNFKKQISYKKDKKSKTSYEFRSKNRSQETFFDSPFSSLKALIKN